MTPDYEQQPYKVELIDVGTNFAQSNLVPRFSLPTVKRDPGDHVVLCKPS